MSVEIRRDGDFVELHDGADQYLHVAVAELPLFIARLSYAWQQAQDEIASAKPAEPKEGAHE